MFDTAWVTGAAGVLGAASAAFVASRRLWKNRLAPIFDSAAKAMIVLNGRDAVTLPEDSAVEVSPPIPGVLDRIADIEQVQGAFVMHLGRMQMSMAKAERDTEHLIGKVHEIEHEVKPNGGASIKDSVCRIENHLTSIDERLQEGDDRFGRIETTIDAALTSRAESETAMWQAIEAVAKASPPEGQ